MLKFYHKEEKLTDGRKIMKKRVISLVLVLIMAFALFGTSAFAAGYNTQCIAPDTAKVGTIKDLKGIEGDIIVYPKSLETAEEGTVYPVIAWANGTGCITSLYYKLFELFAENGYIVIADTNVMAGDGKSISESIDYIIAKNSDPNSVLYGKVDVNNIGAAGHSQGGKGVVCAAAKDPRIKCIFSIAGASTASEAKNVTCPAFYVAGSADLIVFAPMWVKPSYNASSGPSVYACLKLAPHTTCIIVPDKIAKYGNIWFDLFLKGEEDNLAVFVPGGQLSQDKNWRDFASKAG